MSPTARIINKAIVLHFAVLGAIDSIPLDVTKGMSVNLTTTTAVLGYFVINIVWSNRLTVIHVFSDLVS